MIQIDNKFNEGDYVSYKEWIPSALTYREGIGYVVGIKYIKHKFLTDNETEEKVAYKLYYAMVDEKSYIDYLNGWEAIKFYWAEEKDINKICDI